MKWSECLRRSVPRILVVFAIGAASVIGVSTADAQIQTVTPPVFSSVSSVGVDTSTGQYRLTTTEVIIGQPGLGGLVHSREWIGTGWRDGLAGTIASSGTTYTVSLGSSSETFELSLGSYNSVQKQGSTLNLSGNTWTYTTRDGSVFLFDKTKAASGSVFNFWSANEGVVTSLTKPDGEVVTWTYSSDVVSGQTAYRPQSISNNLGYQIHFTYADDDATTTGELTGAYLTRTKATGVNRAYSYCADTAFTCGDTDSSHVPTIYWPYAAYSTSGGIESVTDEMSRVHRYIFASGKLQSVRLPSSPGNDTTIIQYDGSDRVELVVQSGEWTYSYSDASGVRTTTGLSEEGSYHITKTLLSKGWVTELWADATGTRKLVYDRESDSGRITKVTQPSGIFVQYNYDARGNVTQTTLGKPSQTSIITSATFSACTLSTTKWCNKPSESFDARGYRTNYAYNNTHGGVETITYPAPAGATPVGSGVRPEQRFSYSPLTAYFKTGSSTYGAGSTVYRLSGTSECMTTSSCLGGADESVSALGYATHEATLVRNLLPTSMSAGSGTSPSMTTSATKYWPTGDMREFDGPLASDTASFFYNKGRQLQAAVTADPDGAGPQLHRVIRTTYDDDGQPTVIDLGGISSPSAWTSFTPLETHTTQYAYPGVAASKTISVGGTTYAQTEFGVDHALRPQCAAVRMNFIDPIATPGPCGPNEPIGAFGTDRVVKSVLNPYNDQTSVQQGVGGYGARTAVTRVIDAASGLVQSETDAHDNKTTYTYDAFERLMHTYFPDPTNIGSSNLNDYKQEFFDQYGRLGAQRGRDGNWFSYCYDNLQRLVSIKHSGSTYDLNCTSPTRTFQYDNQGRMKQVQETSPTAHTLTYSYDALGRRLNEVRAESGRTISYQYDAAGNRTRITHHDGFYVVYDYNPLGEVTWIRENGGISGDVMLAAYLYDDLGRRSAAFHRYNAPTFEAASAYTYNPLGMTAFSHNLEVGSSNDVGQAFILNPAGGITLKVVDNASYNHALGGASTTSYAIDGLNRYSSICSSPPCHDSRGNMTHDGTQAYAYDYESRLTTAGFVSLYYDPAGRLFDVVGPAGGRRHIYAGNEVIAELHSTTGAVLRRYVYGPGIDEPIVMYTGPGHSGSGTPSRSWLYKDERGSVIATEGSSTTINTYSDYGVPGAGNAGLLQYTGQLYIPDAGIYHYRARAYHPFLGRFLQPDPIGYAAGLNLYAYASNDPANNTDPLGLFDRDIIVITGERGGFTCAEMWMAGVTSIGGECRGYNPCDDEFGLPYSVYSRTCLGQPTFDCWQEQLAPAGSCWSDGSDILAATSNIRAELAHLAAQCKLRKGGEFFAEMGQGFAKGSAVTLGVGLAALATPAAEASPFIVATSGALSWIAAGSTTVGGVMIGMSGGSWDTFGAGAGSLAVGGAIKSFTTFKASGASKSAYSSYSKSERELKDFIDYNTGWMAGGVDATLFLATPQGSLASAC